MEEGRLSGRKRRKACLSRALNRIRLTMRRKPASPDVCASEPVPEESIPSSTVAVSSAAPNQTSEHPIPSNNATGVVAFDIPAATIPSSEPNDTGVADADATASALPLIVDASAPIEVGDPDDHIPPSTTSINGPKPARARVLFERYGIQYEEGTQFQADGRSYVNRLIRIRLHWECHKCKTGFGRCTVCMTCGHARCAECLRSPSPRVKEFLGDTKAMKEIEDQATQVSPNEDVVVITVALASDASTPVHAVTSADASADAATPMDMAAEDEVADPDVDLIQMRYANRRKAGMGPQLHPRPTGDRMRWTCHECGASFTPSHTHQCLHCGHARCSSCPFAAEKTDYPVQLGIAESEPPLRRVYRKPRQRVRWTCERCNATFVSSRTCINCGHERCGSCVRSPVKKPSLTESLSPIQTVAAVA